MHEIGIASEMLAEILAGRKTIEGRLGTPKFLKLRVGDTVSVREDIWRNGKIVESIPNRAVIKITQLLYFESFEEMFGAVNFRLAIPSANSARDALAVYRQFYSDADEYENGVVAITFALQSTLAEK